MPVVKSLEIWTVQTLCNIGILLSINSLLLHIGRPYFERILGRLTLRVAADLWWLVYVMLRDGSLLLAALIGCLCLNLDLMADIKIGLPFVPLATVALSVALVMKVFRNTEDTNRAHRLATYWVICGALLNMIGYVFVMEAPGDEYGTVPLLSALRSLRSNENQGLSVWTFVVSFSLLILVVGYAGMKALSLYATAEKKGVKNA